MTTEAENGVMQRPEAGGNKEQVLLQRLPRELSPADALISDLWPPEL